MRKPPAPWESIEPVPAICSSLRALRAGTADADQQMMAIEFIVGTLCKRGDMTFIPGEDGRRASDFAEGKRFVGNQIVRLANIVPKQK